jgi:hypothetical protein
MTNQLAAMPSLHVGWALWCAWVVFTLTERRWVRIAAIAYPIGTTLVVVGTANHYVLDAVAGIAVMVIAIHVVGRLPQVIRLPEQRGGPVNGGGTDGGIDGGTDDDAEAYGQAA